MFFLSCNGNIENRYYIKTTGDTISENNKAVNNLISYWKKITGKTLISANFKNNDTKIPFYIGNIKNFPALYDSLKKLKKDAFVISVSDTAVILAGKNEKGDLYAVNTFLEDYLGVIKFTPTEEYVTRKESVDLKKSLKFYNPSFSLRIVYFPGKDNESFREWYKLENLDMWGMYVHTFGKLIPPEKYFDSHPEYFSLVNGKRMRDAQLCLSNPEVVKLLIKNLGDTIRKNPSKKYWSVSQNDTYNPCQCENCKKLYKKYGAISGAYVKTVNEVAGVYKDKIISTLAYQFTRKAPKNIKPDSNVNIMLCTIECSRSKPLEEFKNKNSFSHDFMDWSKLTDNIYLWDYVVQFKNLLAPFPNFPVLQPNLKFFKNNNVDMIFEQGSGRYWSDLMELKQYLLAKLVWNVNLDVDSLAISFINAYYGGAGKYIAEYYNTMNKAMIENSDKETLNIYGNPSDYTKTFLKPALMKKYLDLMDSAETSVSGDSVLFSRVKRTRISVDFAWVDISVNNNFPSMPSIIEMNGKKVINPLIVKLLDNMVKYSETDESVVVNERGFKLSYYRNYVLGLLKRKLLQNKLGNAKITLLSQPSGKYPVGGGKALTDNIFGPLDFRHNWLGFNGDDMIAVFEFKNPVKLSTVEMNFLKDVNSWIFLPVEVKVDVSKDGIHYKETGKIKTTDNDRSYSVESVPYDFKFKPVDVKFLKVTANSVKNCPEWHKGFGNPAWIFVDEIIAY